MRSVFLFLIDTTREEVGDCLSALCPSKDTYLNTWVTPPDRPVLYIHHWEDYARDFEEHKLAALFRALGGPPAVVLMVDVSGRVAGDAEVKWLFSTLLSRFRGFAQDDYTEHCWTAAEIESGHTVEGHPFFDYDGWHDEHRTRDLILPLTRGQAETLVHAAINPSAPDAIEMVITSVEDRNHGWLIHWTSRAWHETGDFAHAIAGNGPYYVTRSDGRLFPLGTVCIAEQLNALEQQLETPFPQDTA